LVVKDNTGLKVSSNSWANWSCDIKCKPGKSQGGAPCPPLPRAGTHFKKLTDRKPWTLMKDAISMRDVGMQQCLVEISPPMRPSSPPGGSFMLHTYKETDIIQHNGNVQGTGDSWFKSDGAKECAISNQPGGAYYPCGRDECKAEKKWCPDTQEAPLICGSKCSINTPEKCTGMPGHHHSGWKFNLPKEDSVWTDPDSRYNPDKKETHRAMCKIWKWLSCKACDDPSQPCGNTMEGTSCVNTKVCQCGGSCTSKKNGWSDSKCAKNCGHKPAERSGGCNGQCKQKCNSDCNCNGGGNRRPCSACQRTKCDQLCAGA
jgi:hypothetical protein